MRDLLKKIHLYAGLLAFSAMTVWGIVGVISMMEPPFEKRHRLPPETRALEKALPEGLADRAASEWIRREAGLAMVNPAVLRRDKQQNLVCEFYGPNGMTRAVVDEARGRQVTLTRQKISLSDFLNRAHAMSPRTRIEEWPARVWAFYNELGLWAMLLMILSGVWLWLGSRPDWKPAWLALALGAGAFAALWVVTP